MTRGRLIAVICAACLQLGLPSLAGASTVTATTDYLSVRDEVGETNGITMTRVNGTRDIRIEDTAGITTAGGCVRESATVVRCAARDGSPHQTVNIAVRTGPGNDDVFVGPSLIDIRVYGLAVYGGDGDDDIRAHTRLYDDELLGERGEDELRQEGDRAGGELEGGPGNDSIYGGDAHSLLIGDDGSDTIVGGPGNEQISGRGGADDIDAGAGHDQVSSGEGADTLRGGAGADRVLYNLGPAVMVDLAATGPVQGGTLDGPPGARDSAVDFENVSGGNGNDHLRGDAGRNQIFGGGGDDTVLGEGGPDQLDGSSGVDTVRGGGDDDLLVGGLEEGDRIEGDDGADTADFRRTTGVTIIVGETAACGAQPVGFAAKVSSDIETVWGGYGRDRIVGDDGPNVLKGSSERDVVRGCGGDDTLIGDWGDDDLVGDDGFDTASYANRSTGVTARIGVPEASGSPGERDTVDSTTEALVGSQGSDMLFGDGGANTLDGGPGDDVVDGGHGPDVLEGGEGTDTVTYESRTAGVVAQVGRGESGNADDGPASARDEIGSSVENLSGGSGADRLYGDGQANPLGGGGGDDLLDGRTGSDTLVGDAGLDRASYATRTSGVILRIGVAGASGNSADGPSGRRDTIDASTERLDGGRGDDFLFGSPFSNHIRGGPGDDTIDSGSGHDLVEGGSGGDDVTTGNGNDRVLVRDGELDRVGCGNDDDRVDADSADQIAADCEQRTP